MRKIYLAFFALTLLVMHQSTAQACSDGTIQNETVTFSSNCTLTTLTIQGTSTLNISAGVTVSVTTLDLNYGDYSVNLGAGAILNISGEFDEAGGGTQTFTGGTINITGDLTSTSGGTLNFNNTAVTASTISINSTLNLTNSTMTGTSFSVTSGRVVTIQSSSSLNVSGTLSANGPINVDDSSIDADFMEVLSGRTITLTNNSNFFVDGTVDLQGNLYIDNSDMEIVQNLDHDTGGDATVTVTNNGTLLVRGNYDMGDGSTGGFDLDITNGGVVRVLGDLNIGNNSNAVDIDGNSALAVEGDVTGDDVEGSITSGGAESCEAGGGTCCGSASLCSSTASTLPIELLSFEAASMGNGVTIEWVTATEINNEFFVVEGSIDGITFEEVARITGAGTTTNELRYKIIDYPDYFGIIFYRLTQTDFDGTTEIFNPVTVSHFKVNQNEVTFFPSSIKAGTSLRTRNFWGESIALDMKMISMSGKSLYPLRHSISGGMLQIFIPESTRPGMYILSGQINGQEVMGRILVTD